MRHEARIGQSTNHKSAIVLERPDDRPKVQVLDLRSSIILSVVMYHGDNNSSHDMNSLESESVISEGMGSLVPESFPARAHTAWLT